MSRRRFLITYDIVKDKRRTKVFKSLKGEGDHVQYSVFMCELDSRERTVLESKLTDLINNAEDQILFLDLGPSSRLPDTIVSTLGKPYAAPVDVLVI